MSAGGKAIVYKATVFYQTEQFIYVGITESEFNISRPTKYGAKYWEMKNLSSTIHL